MSTNPYGSTSGLIPDAPGAPGATGVQKARKVGVTLCAVVLLLYGVLGLMGDLSAFAMAAIQAAGIDLQQPPPNATREIIEFQERMKEVGKVGPVGLVLIGLDLIVCGVMIYSGIGIYGNLRSKVPLARLILVASVVVVLMAFAMTTVTMLQVVGDPSLNNAGPMGGMLKAIFIGSIAMQGVMTAVKAILSLVAFSYLGKQTTLDSMI